MSKNDQTPLQKAKAKYERERRGKTILKVVQSPSDDLELWERIKRGLVEKYGSAKQGILELARKDGLVK